MMYMTCICGRITYTGSTALALDWHSCFHGAQLVDNLEIVGMEIWSRVIVCRAWDTKTVGSDRCRQRSDVAWARSMISGAYA